ncbi:MAG TPA: hypothetical protein VEW91_00220 [bacterium]|nr:hypothetical protein [bacterium]
MYRYRWGFGLVVLAALAVGALALGPGVLGPRVGAPPSPPATPDQGSAGTRAAATLSSLVVTPDQGPAGTRIQVAGTGLPPQARVTFLWYTAGGRYRTDVDPGGVVFHGYAYDPMKAVLGDAVADSQGRAVVSFSTPDDLAGPHRISAAVGDREVAQGLFHYLRSATMTPLRGPVGTPIDITIHGLGPAPWNAAALSYDNHYIGFVSAVTTHGTAHVRIRAAGTPGPHYIDLNSASNATPFLNSGQGPGLELLRIVSHRSWTFTVTEGTTFPPTQVEWPAADRVARLGPDAPRTTAPQSQPASGISLALTPTSGLTLSRVEVRAKGLRPGEQAQIVWGTMGRGTRLTTMPSVETQPLLAAAAAPDGALSGQFVVPHDLGGWHTIQLVRDGSVLAYAPYFVARNLVAVTPSRVRAGQQFKVELRGIGWTELDNGVAVTYDNAYAGYACGFNARGDVIFSLTASGAPGVHLIDLYPMIYQGKGEPPWSYQVPHLTALEDAPGLALGYPLPIFRLAVVVTP